MSVEKKCLSCKYFRPEDQFTGRCRVDKDHIDPDRYPIMKHDDLCERWENAGQQYFIRVGWLKNKQNHPNAEDA